MEKSTFRNIAGHQTSNLPPFQRLLLFSELHHEEYLHPTLTFIYKSAHLIATFPMQHKQKLQNRKYRYVLKAIPFSGLFYCFRNSVQGSEAIFSNWNPFWKWWKMIFIQSKKLFSFLWYLIFCPDFFGYVENILIRNGKNRVKWMIARHILPNNARCKGNQIMKLGQLIEYNMKNVFLQKSLTKYDGEPISRPLCY